MGEKAIEQFQREDAPEREKPGSTGLAFEVSAMNIGAEGIDVEAARVVGLGTHFGSAFMSVRHQQMRGGGGQGGKARHTQGERERGREMERKR